MSEDLDLLTIAEAARYAGVSDRALRYAARKGLLKARRIGSVWITTKAAVDHWKSDPLAHRRPPRRKSKG